MSEYSTQSLYVEILQALWMESSVLQGEHFLTGEQSLLSLTGSICTSTIVSSIQRLWLARSDEVESHRTAGS